MTITMPAPESFADTADMVPYAFYERVRENGGILWDAAAKSWIVVDYDLVQAILRDDDTFAHPYATMQAGDTYLKIRSGNPRSMMFLKGAEHRAFHKWWLVELLSPKAVRAYRSTMVEPWVATLIDRLSTLPAFDLVEDFAERVPMGVFAVLLDIPEQDQESLDHMKALNDAIADFATIANAMKLEGELSEESRRISDRAVNAAEELNAILMPLVLDRKDGTREDFISKLWKGGSKIFPDWNEIDTLDACRRLLFAGVDTTTHAICNAFHLLLTDAQLFCAVRDGGEEALNRFVEEVLRTNGSVQFRPRRVTKDDVSLGNVAIAKGDMLTVSLLGANRDAKHYDCPHAIKLDRAHAYDHFAFASGPRTCVGMHLARAEIAAAVGQMLARFPGLQLDTTREPPRFEGYLMRSWRPLYVRTDQ